MTRHVYVTPAQKDAARLIVKRTTAKGREVPADVLKIAKAKTTGGSWVVHDTASGGFEATGKKGGKRLPQVFGKPLRRAK